MFSATCSVACFLSFLLMGETVSSAPKRAILILSSTLSRLSRSLAMLKSTLLVEAFRYDFDHALDLVSWLTHCSAAGARAMVLEELESCWSRGHLGIHLGCLLGLLLVEGL